MVILRGIGWLLLLMGVLVVVYGAVIWRRGVLIFEQSGGEYWFEVDSESLNLVQAVIQRYLHPSIWDPFLVDMLLWPIAWGLGVVAAVFLVPGILILAVFRQPRRRRLMR